MKYDVLLMGLGNPTTKYALTRHNVGFLYLDALAEAMGVNWTLDKKMQAEVAQVRINGMETLLMKPQTYMNKSGESLTPFLRYHSAANIVVVYDDKDIPFGTIRWRDSGGHGGHNGVRDLLRVAGEVPLQRLKFGIDGEERREHNIDTAHWVLAKFPPEDLTRIRNELVPRAATLMMERLTGSVRI